MFVLITIIIFSSFLRNTNLHLKRGVYYVSLCTHDLTLNNMHIHIHAFIQTCTCVQSHCVALYIYMHHFLRFLKIFTVFRNSNFLIIDFVVVAETFFLLLVLLYKLYIPTIFPSHLPAAKT